MVGFLRYVSLQRYVSVQMVIAPPSSSPPSSYPPYGPYPSGSGSFPYPSRSQFCSSIRFRFGGGAKGYTGVPLSRHRIPEPLWNGYTSVYVSLLISPQFYRKGRNDYTDVDSGEETGLGQEILDVKSEISVQGDSALKKFCNFFENITQFLESLEKFLIISMAYMNKTFGDVTKASLENNGTQMSTTRDSNHCYHYCYCYDRDYDRDCVPEIPEYCPCIPLRIGASLGHEIIENRYNGKMVEKCCKYCKLCNPPRPEAKNRTQAANNRTLAAGDSNHCYYYCYCYDSDDRDGIPVSPECCPCIPLRIGAYLGHEIIERGYNGKMVEKCCKYCKLCNPPRGAY